MSPETNPPTRNGSTIRFEATADLASATFGTQGGNKTANRIYARRVVACVRACHSIPTEALEEINSAGHGFASLARTADKWHEQRNAIAAEATALLDYLYRNYPPDQLDGETKDRMDRACKAIRESGL